MARTHITEARQVTQVMEHRWGNRCALGTATELRTADGRVEGVRIRDASISGAFVETHARFIPLGRVSVKSVAWPDEWLDGCVVRIDSQGIALEWLAPELSCLAAFIVPDRREN